MKKKTDKQDNLAGQRATVVGLGMEGVDLVRYLSARGADITVSDSRPAERLNAALNELAGMRMHLSLGEHDEAVFSAADCLYVSQGVPLDMHAISAAREKGVPVRSMMQLFLQECPGRVIGVTGSSGKSTVTALLGEILQTASLKKFVGGNIGVPLLAHLDEIDAATWVVLEMSHTQLQLVDRSPEIASVINVTPNHLDRFAWEDYIQLKRNVLRFQDATNIAVLNADNDISRGFAADTTAAVILTSLEGRAGDASVFLESERVVSNLDGSESELLSAADIHLPGRHNLEDVVMAAALAVAAGVSPQDIRAAVRSFHGIPHRLELVRRVNGVGYYNDSIATTPDRTVAGLRAFEQPIVLLAGGRHKNLPWDHLVDEIKARCHAVICFGEAGPEVVARLHRSGYEDVQLTDDLHEAVERAAAAARHGDIVLLSPACTSFDAYENFEQRGDHFRRLVMAIREAP